jgi:hypothetical protein
MWTHRSASGQFTWKTGINRIELIISETKTEVYLNGVKVGLSMSTVKYPIEPTPIFGLYATGVSDSQTIKISELGFTPSISYADDFATNTVSRTAAAGMYIENLNVYSTVADASTMMNTTKRTLRNIGTQVVL